MSTEERMDFIEFRQDLLFDNDEVSRLLFEYKITRPQYIEIMKLMDDYRKRIEANQKVSNSSFENAIYAIVPQHAGDYHFCKMLAKAFMEERRWEEVFQALYGNMAKYEYLKKQG